MQQGRIAMAITAVWSLLTVGMGFSADLVNWPYRMTIQFPGYQSLTVLNDFQALVVLGTHIPGFSYDQFSSAQGFDLRFSATGTNELPYEIDEWNTNGLSYAWVRIPRFSSTTKIHAYWGHSPAVTPPAYTTNGAVWAESYSIVEHLRDSESLAGGPAYRNSASNRPPVGAADQASAAGQGGRVGAGVEFDGINDRLMQRDLTWADGANTFTFSMWVKAHLSHEIDGEGNSGASGVGGQRYCVWPSHGGDYYAGAGISAGINGITVYEHGSGYMPALLVWQGDVSDWRHITVVYQDRQPTLYVDGQPVRTGVTSARSMVRTGGQLGGDVYGYFDGYLDEFRFSSQAESPDRILAMYLNMASNAYFNAYGPAVTYGLPTVQIW